MSCSSEHTEVTRALARKTPLTSQYAEGLARKGRVAYFCNRDRGRSRGRGSGRGKDRNRGKGRGRGRGARLCGGRREGGRS